MIRQAQWCGLWLMGLVILAGCTGPSRVPSMLIAPPEARALGYGLLWASDMAVPRDHSFKTWLLEDMLLVSDDQTNVITAVALRDGHTLWATAVGTPSQPIVGAARQGAHVYVNSPTVMYTLDADLGRLKAIHNLPSPVSGSPTLSEDWAIFGSNNGLIFPFRLGSGQLRWTSELTSAITTRPVLVGSTNVFAADTTGVYALLALSDRTIGWKSRTFGAVSAQPVASNLGVFVPSQDQNLYALNVLSGKDLWVFRAGQPLKRDLVLAEKTLLVPLSNELVAIDAASQNGTVLWRVPTAGTPVGTVSAGILVNEGRRLVALDPQTGKPRQEIPTRRLRSVYLLPNKSLVVVGPTGRVARYDPQ